MRRRGRETVGRGEKGERQWGEERRERDSGERREGRETVGKGEKRHRQTSREIQKVSSFSVHLLALHIACHGCTILSLLPSLIWSLCSKVKRAGNGN